MNDPLTRAETDHSVEASLIYAAHTGEKRFYEIAPPNETITRAGAPPRESIEVRVFAFFAD